MSTNKKLYKLSVNQIKNITARKHPLLAYMYKITGHLVGLEMPRFMWCQQMKDKMPFTCAIQMILGYNEMGMEMNCR